MTIAIAPHTRIDNDIIDNMFQIGVYGYAVYSIIKRHLNQKTGDCYPSYATIAKKAGIDRGTVIRYVSKLKALHLLSPMLRFKEDGSPTSNQYTFQGTGNSAPAKMQGTENPVPSKIQEAESSTPSKEVDKPIQIVQDSGSEPPSLVAEDNHPGGSEPPEQVFSSNKTQRTITEVDLMPTDKQKTCPHPPELIVILPDNITICNHCYSLLDENLQLKEEKTPPPAEREAA
jgi:hypothetical protein